MSRYRSLRSWAVCRQCMTAHLSSQPCPGCDAEQVHRAAAWTADDLAPRPATTSFAGSTAADQRVSRPAPATRRAPPTAQERSRFGPIGLAIATLATGGTGLAVWAIVEALQ